MYSSKTDVCLYTLCNSIIFLKLEVKSVKMWTIYHMSVTAIDSPLFC